MGVVTGKGPRAVGLLKTSIAPEDWWLLGLQQTWPFHPAGIWEPWSLLCRLLVPMAGGELCVPTGIRKDSGCGHMRTTVPTGLVLHPSRDMPPRLLWSYVIVALTKA